MTNEHEHPADAPEQEITSETPEFAAEMAERTIEPGDRPKATMPEPETSLSDEPERGGSDAAISNQDGTASVGRKADENQSEAHDENPPKLERLQKILAQAGVASRRHAEELITGGRVQVNGQTVTVLGSKADPQRDHIRVDGKLLHGAERLRYFVLNKPRGYVTTVTDPEGRPTVMQFFAKTGERLYPVGRLDYQSEGLLLVTNDGELANKLTRAASNVEKTYLVKIAGQPGEDQLERLRSGVAIDKGQPQQGKVHTAPAHIRQVRKGDNPWFEVILIEGRNRELRKMFEEIGHHVEKIRRVGYGPLILDVEPGKFRELDKREIDALRLTAEGKLKPRRPKASLLLPKDAGKPAEERAARGKRPGRRFEPSDERKRGTRPPLGARPVRRFEPGDRAGRDRAASARPERSGRKEESTATRREPFRRTSPDKREGDARARPFGDRRTPDRKAGGRDGFRGPSGPQRRFPSNRPRTDRPGSDRPMKDRPGGGRPSSDRPGRSTDKRREGFVRREPNAAAPRREPFQRPAPAKLTIEPASHLSEGRKPEGREDFRWRSGPPRQSSARQSFDGPSRGPRQDRGERRERPPQFRGGRPGSQRRESTSPRLFRPERPSGGRSERRERPAAPSRDDRKPGSSFRGKPVSKPDSKSGLKPGGGAKRSSPRPGGNFGGAKRGNSKPGGKRNFGAGAKRNSKPGGKRNIGRRQK